MTANPEPAAYDLRGSRSVRLAAGASTIFWAATDPHTVHGSISCPGGVTLLGRSISERAWMPRLFSRGTGLDANLVGVTTGSIAFDVGPNGMALVGNTGIGGGAVHAEWDGDSADVRGPITLLQFPAKGNLTIEATMADYYALAYAIVASLEPVAFLPDETRQS